MRFTYKKNDNDEKFIVECDGEFMFECLTEDLANRFVNFYNNRI